MPGISSSKELHVCIFTSKPSSSHQHAYCHEGSMCTIWLDLSHVLQTICPIHVDGYDRSNPEHHRLMCSLIMTSCDLTSSCKTWECSKAISVSILGRDSAYILHYTHMHTHTHTYTFTSSPMPSLVTLMYLCRT